LRFPQAPAQVYYHDIVETAIAVLLNKYHKIKRNMKLMHSVLNVVQFFQNPRGQFKMPDARGGDMKEVPY